MAAIVTSPTAGAGAGVLTWAKTNWLVTTYAPTAPFIVAPPQNTSVAAGQTATLTVVAGGSASLSYQWYFNTNTPVAGATNSTLLVSNAQSANAGLYSVTVTNLAGSATSASAALSVTTSAPTNPQLSGAVYGNGTFGLTVNGSAGYNYVVQASTNLLNWTSLFTNPMPTLPFLWTDPAASNFSQRFYRVQAGP